MLIFVGGLRFGLIFLYLSDYDEGEHNYSLEELFK